ncbi:hypothetical protein CP532_7046 [Ophiocordyceps camponoti-leonardi (nom. inval.)]|nr:hypothetical protein CP532_7046 [Ophiocordyceps camponoti-leonardi (nom. inval.)]
MESRPCEDEESALDQDPGPSRQRHGPPPPVHHHHSPPHPSPTTHDHHYHHRRRHHHHHHRQHYHQHHLHHQHQQPPQYQNSFQQHHGSPFGPSNSHHLPPSDNFITGASNRHPIQHPSSPLLYTPDPLVAPTDPRLKAVARGVRTQDSSPGWEPAPAGPPHASPPARPTPFARTPSAQRSFGADGHRNDGPRTPQPLTPRAQQVAAAADGTSAPTMPNLLAPGRTQALGDMRFSLRMRQQPRAARACGFGDRDRRVIDPPPIVQLVIESGSMTDDEVQSYLRYESYVMNCAICDETGTRDASFMPEGYQHQRRLMGALVGTPFVGRDDQGVEGCFFCFGDLSCRTPGAFRLKFTLIMIDPMRAGIIRHFPILTEAVSDVFHVYSAKEFPGMLPSSNLAKRLKEQGCIISIKKGNERSKPSSSSSPPSSSSAHHPQQQQQQKQQQSKRGDEASDVDEDAADVVGQGSSRRRRLTRD